MPDDRRHESEDLRDYEVLDAADTLTGNPGDDPLDRGVVTPAHWSSAMKFGATAGEQQAGESLDQLLAAEEPDISLDGATPPEDLGWDENATEGDIDRLSRHQDADPRTGRLLPDDEGVFLGSKVELVAQDAGIDGGGATAEETAIHMVTDDEPDQRVDDSYL